MLPEIELNLLREQLDKHTTFSHKLTGNDRFILLELELEQIAYDSALQHRGNFHTNRQGRAREKYRLRHGLGGIWAKDEGTEPILLQEMIAVYMEKYPETVLDGAELETAAQAECLTEKDGIDTEINKDIVGNGDLLLSDEQRNIVSFSNTKAGIKDKLSNLKRAVVTATWKE